MSMDFIAGGVVELVGGISSAIVLFAYAWWAPLVLAGAWGSTHWLLRESAIWRDYLHATPVNGVECRTK